MEAPSPPSILSLREAPRKRLGLAYEAVTDRWAAEFGDDSRPSVSKIHRWENGSRSREPDFVARLCALYQAAAQEKGIDIEAELEGLRYSESMQDDRAGFNPQSPAERADAIPSVLPEGAALRFGLVAYPDSAIMAAVMKNLFRENVEIVALEPAQGARIPDMILAGELDFGLHNSAGLAAHSQSPLDPAQFPFQVTAVMRFRGNALLAASGAGPDGAKPWSTFKEHYMNNADGKIAPDHADRILNALARTLYQLVDGRHKVDADHLALPGQGSNRRAALIQLLRLAQESKFITPADHSKLKLSPGAKKLQALIDVLEKPAGQPRTGVQSFYEFAKAIDPGAQERTRALFYAGVTHRIIAESEFAAAPLIDSDDLLLICTLNPGCYRAFFPTNVLVRSRNATDRVHLATRMLGEQWNKLVRCLRDKQVRVFESEEWAHIVQMLNTDVDRYMIEALEKYGDPSLTRVSWRPGKRLFEQLMERQMVEMLPWLE